MTYSDVCDPDTTRSRTPSNGNVAGVAFVPFQRGCCVDQHPESSRSRFTTIKQFLKRPPLLAVWGTRRPSRCSEIGIATASESRVQADGIVDTQVPGQQFVRRCG